MSRDLPYFKFFTGEWLNGDITLIDLELQGLFINLCAYYWHRECELTLNQANRRFGILTDLISEELISIDEYEFLRIDFLDEQFQEFSTRKKQLSEAGKKGAMQKKIIANKKIEELYSGSSKLPFNYPSTTKEDKDKDKDKDKIKNIKERRKDFSLNLLDYIPKFGGEMVNEFFLYWSEHGENDKKMRYEKQTSFSIERRLGTWKKNQKTFKDGYKTTAKNNSARTTQAGRQSFD